MDLHKFLFNLKNIKIIHKDTQVLSIKTIIMIAQTLSKILIAIKQELQNRLNSTAKITEIFKIFKNRKMNKNQVIARIKIRYKTSKKPNIMIVSCRLI